MVQHEKPGYSLDSALQNFKRAFQQLSAAVELAEERDLSDLEQQGLIQAFEFTHRAGVNTLKDFLESRGNAKIFGSKDAAQAAFTAGLIADGSAWMEMVESRNKSTHTYETGTAEAMAKLIISSYQPAFKTFQKKFTELQREEAWREPRTDRRAGGANPRGIAHHPEVGADVSTVRAPREIPARGVRMLTSHWWAQG